MLQLPQPPESPNVRALAQCYLETFTGLTVATVTLTHTPVRTVDDVGLEAVLLNGQRLTVGSDYTINGAVITLLAPFGPLVASDALDVHFPYRPTQ